jgi:SAM-dependent methyltransferase
MEHETACPACGSPQWRPTGGKVPGFSVVVDGEEFKQPSYFVRECSNCALLYRTQKLRQTDLDRYYARFDFRKWEIAGYYPTERCVLSRLRALPKGSRILDFGCSSGRLLAGLSADYKCYGVEVNAVAAQEAGKKGLKVLTSDDLENPELPKFDAIVLVDLFEHMSRPLDLLRRVVRVLTDDRLLIIVTGNGDAPACRRDPAQFWYFRTHEHLCMLTRAHTQFLVSTLGIRLEEWVELCHYDLSWREKLIQILQNFAYWEFRNRTFLARTVLRLLPCFRRLKTGRVAPSYTCSRDHVVAVFTKRGQEIRK